MGFRAPDPPNLLPLLLQHTLNQRLREEENQRRLEEERRSTELFETRRSEEALNQGISFLEKGMPIKDALPILRQRGLRMESESFLVGLDKTMRQQQKAAEAKSQADRATGLAAPIVNEFGQLQSDPQSQAILESAIFQLQSELEGPEEESALTDIGLKQQELSRKAKEESVKRRGELFKQRPVAFFDPDTGEFVSAQLPGTQGFIQAVNSGLAPIATAVQGTSPSDIFGDKVLRREAVKEATGAAQRRNKFSSALRTVRRADPASFGVPVRAANLFGSVLVQLSGDPDQRRRITSMITTDDPAMLDRLAVEGQSLAAQSIAVFTGEEEGRKTAEELQISTDTLFGTAMTQERFGNALEYLVGMEAFNEQAAAVRGGLDVKYKLFRRANDGSLIESQKEAERLSEDLEKQGLSKENAIEFTVRIMNVHKDLMSRGFLPSKKKGRK